MKEFDNNHKEALKRALLFVGIGNSLDNDDLLELVDGVFDTAKLEALVTGPLEEMQEAGVDDDAMKAVFRFLLIEAFPSAVL